MMSQRTFVGRSRAVGCISSSIGKHTRMDGFCHSHMLEQGRLVEVLRVLGIIIDGE
jgi:hypothetical protein